jgi:hypothetical protein
MDRRQSWSQQDQKRELQMLSIAEVSVAPGFSERPLPSHDDHQGFVAAEAREEMAHHAADQ